MGLGVDRWLKRRGGAKLGRFVCAVSLELSDVGAIWSQWDTCVVGGVPISSGNIRHGSGHEAHVETRREEALDELGE